MMIEEIITITGPPGAYLAGTIESRVVQVGDELDLLDGGHPAGQVRCVGIGVLDSVRDPGRCRAAVHVDPLRQHGRSVVTWRAVPAGPGVGGPAYDLTLPGPPAGASPRGQGPGRGA